MYRIQSAFPERKPYATYVHQLVKATSLMLTKETAKGHVGLTGADPEGGRGGPDPPFSHM